MIEEFEPEDWIVENSKKRMNNPLMKGLLEFYNFIVEHLGEKTWEDRKEKIIEGFSYSERLLSFQRYGGLESPTEASLSYDDDLPAWYLYLVECWALRPTSDEGRQANRLMNIFSYIGTHLSEFFEVENWSEKFDRLMDGKQNQPDAVMFEIAVAIMYKRNGWNVEFIPEAAKKTPDLYIYRDDEELYVECKRLAKITEYAKEEKNEWYRLWRYISPLFLVTPRSLFLDFDFKEELKNIDGEYFASIVKDFVKKFFCKGWQFFEAEDFSVKVEWIDEEKICNHFKEFFVKYPSGQLLSLMDRDYGPHESYTFISRPKIFEINNGKDVVLNAFASSLGKVLCAKWKCTSFESINNKAKDVKRQLVKAVDQAPREGVTNIHIAYETMHGPELEFLRDKKISSMVQEFDFGDKEIGSVICHSYQARDLGCDTFDFAETIRYYNFFRSFEDVAEKGMHTSLINQSTPNETHWLQDFMDS